MICEINQLNRISLIEKEKKNTSTCIYSPILAERTGDIEDQWASCCFSFEKMYVPHQCRRRSKFQKTDVATKYERHRIIDSDKLVRLEAKTNVKRRVLCSLAIFVKIGN